MAAFKSEFIHSYGMFHPTAPNFRLSRMRALKKTSEKHNFLNARAAEHDSYSSSCRESKEGGGSKVKLNTGLDIQKSGFEITQLHSNPDPASQLT